MHLAIILRHIIKNNTIKFTHFTQDQFSSKNLRRVRELF